MANSDDNSRQMAGLDASVQLTTLHKKRGAIKRKITEFSKFIQILRGQTPTRTQIIELESRVDRFLPLLDHLEDIQNEIYHLEPADETTEQNYVTDMESIYYAVLAEARLLLENSRPAPVSEHNSASDIASQVSDQAGSGNFNSGPNRCQIKLPTIALPKFDGHYTNWLEFHDTFKSLIHENESLSDVQRFHYLRASLCNDAADIIKSLQLTSANYTIAWNLLCERFTNKKLLVQNHLRELFNLNECLKESAPQLREMLDNISKHLRSLESLGQPVQHWDSVIIFLVSSKFDKLTARDWELCKHAEQIPTLEELKTFISNKADMLDNLNLRDSRTPKAIQKPQKTYSNSNIACYYCKGAHVIYNCSKFLSLSISDRISKVKALKLCTNCLRNTHMLDKCDSRSRGCRRCARNHNTLLHLDNAQPKKEIHAPCADPMNLKDETESGAAKNSDSQVSLSSQVPQSSSQVLLATALITVKDKNGNPHQCRALLDSASQSNFISKSLQEKLGLPTSKGNIPIQGINQAVSVIRSKCSVNVSSRVRKFVSDINCLVIDQICDDLPSIPIDENSLLIPEELELADPHFITPGRIDMLIGAQFFWYMLIPGQIILGKHLPILQNSRLGWIISGTIPSNLTPSSRCFFTKTQLVQDQLHRFWELEECPKVKLLSPEQKLCEQLFSESLQRDDSGRYVVSIPLKDPPAKLGDSRSIAEKRLLSLERKFKSNPSLKHEYTKFMDEYESLGHMSKIENPTSDSVQYFLPHHVVVNDSSKTTKHRVVFDGSCPSSSGVSLNDLQLVGPTVQNDLFTILVRFRQHPVAFTADVQKMYRQVLVNPTDRCLQRILWRSDSSSPIHVYELNTITYGTASAPFLATRCLVEIANENHDKFPEASEKIRSDFYVDDILSGGSTEEEVRVLCQQISDILSQIHFKLHKWVSNKPQVLSNLVESCPDQDVQIGSGEITKTLGLYWSPTADTLHYKISSVSEISIPITKRGILSQISQIFDPLGLLSACLVVGKILLQELWQEQLGWDDPVSEGIVAKWQRFQTELVCINHLQIPRYISCSKPSSIELHCFSDASEKAYAACIYFRTSDESGQVHINLLCAKSKVAPLKKLTIPRLELCAAHLAAKLLTVVLDSFQLSVQKIFMWCDSTIVLGWINTPLNLLKVFVGHRVADIQDKCASAQWRHVPTSDNPADLGSRGVSPPFLESSSIWWHGPQWLALPSDQWPPNLPSHSRDNLPEVKRVEISCPTLLPNVPIEFTRFSNFNRLVRCMAFCMRFIQNCRVPVISRNLGCLSVEELDTALIILIKTVQNDAFHQELKLLTNNKPLPSKNQLLCLNPFIDSDKILRVGGRLQASTLDHDRKHPILLPKHYVTGLLFKAEHKRLGHAGPQLLITSIRNKFWPLGARNYARLTVYKCAQCFKCKPTNSQPLMGNLPADRVCPSSPFQFVGVDYAGPLTIKDRKGRGCQVSKCYVAIFICLAVKAIHIELVSSSSTEAFLAALKRFIGRRGRPNKIYSDNGSNFVGANRELAQLFSLLKDNSNEISESLSGEGISWSFIPPSAPNFGGLWEAAVKRVKFHLHRIVGASILTFEQLNTLLVQIECMLNSRPLTQLSSDPNDLEPLTPAHFLIGRPIAAVPEQSLTHLSSNRLSDFQRVQQLCQNFWTRWQQEYLQELQVRTKAQGHTDGLKLGSMVLLHEPSSPPFKWPIGRITEVFPGPDGVIRVASIQTARGIYRRAASKVYPLPGDMDSDLKSKHTVSP